MWRERGQGRGGGEGHRTGPGRTGQDGWLRVWDCRGANSGVSEDSAEHSRQHTLHPISHPPLRRPLRPPSPPASLPTPRTWNEPAPISTDEPPMCGSEDPRDGPEPPPPPPPPPAPAPAAPAAAAAAAAAAAKLPASRPPPPPPPPGCAEKLGLSCCSAAIAMACAWGRRQGGNERGSGGSGAQAVRSRHKPSKPTTCSHALCRPLAFVPFN